MRVALVTGGSRGIGRAICAALARDGFDLAVVGRDRAALAETRALVEAAGRRALELVCDVREADGVEVTVAAAARHFGGLDLLVNNAGRGSERRPSPEQPLSAAEWEQGLRLNLTAAYLFCNHAVAHLKAAPGGAIVNVASVAARQASYLSDAAYSAAKTGLIGLSRHLARELGPSGVRVNAVAPGIVESQRVKRKFDALAPGERDAILGRIPLRRLGSVEEVAEVVAFLASARAAYVHGAVIDVNGGLFMP